VITDLIVAVVDDESPVRTMLGRVLRIAGYRVALFAAGEEFLESLQSQPLACVLLDIHMPGLTGLEVHARMRAARCDAPVIFITASDDADLDGATRKLAARLLRKPFSSDELLTAVGAVIATPDEAT
jgi:FixJ family two-component response regulator